MMGTLSGEPSWLATIAGVPEEDLRPDLDALTAGPTGWSLPAGRLWCFTSSENCTPTPTAKT
jgi:hypothetical protein